MDFFSAKTFAVLFAISTLWSMVEINMRKRENRAMAGSKSAVPYSLKKPTFLLVGSLAGLMVSLYYVL